MATRWADYEYQPSFILGFHGCDASVRDRLLTGEERHLHRSERIYDWLGHGIYFWEGNAERAVQWAQYRKSDGKIDDPAVLGAVIDLGHCLDLFSSDGLAEVAKAHRDLVATFKAAGQEVPKNVGPTPDKAGRNLDCAVLNFLHQYREENDLPAYDTVRAPFLEGDRIYKGAGFRRQNHIQICVRDERMIKGYFRPIQNGI